MISNQFFKTNSNDTYARNYVSNFFLKSFNRVDSAIWSWSDIVNINSNIFVHHTLTLESSIDVQKIKTPKYLKFSSNLIDKKPSIPSHPNPHLSSTSYTFVPSCIRITHLHKKHHHHMSSNKAYNCFDDSIAPKHDSKPNHLCFLSLAFPR